MSWNYHRTLRAFKSRHAADGYWRRYGRQLVAWTPAADLMQDQRGEHRAPVGASLISLRTQRSHRFKHRRRVMFNRACRLSAGRALVPAMLAARMVALPNDPDRFWRAQARLTARLTVARAEIRDRMRLDVTRSLGIPAPLCSVCGDPLDDGFHGLLWQNARLHRIH